MAELPPDIEELVDQKRRADDPSQADQARVGRSLAAALGLPQTGWTAADAGNVAEAASGAVPATQAIGTATFGAGLKAALAAAIVLTGAGAVFVWRANPPTRDSRLQRSAAPSSVVAGTTAPEDPYERLAIRRATPLQQTPTGVVARPKSAPLVPTPTRPRVIHAAPSPHAQTVDGEAPSTQSSARSRARPDGAKPSASDPGIQSAVSQTPETELAPSAAESGTQQSGRAEPKVVSKPADESLLKEELSLITEASQALDTGDGKAALRALLTHRSRFSTGFLREEREALWVVALCELGQTSKAAAARAQFERSAPRSPLRVRIERQCKTPLTVP